MNFKFNKNTRVKITVARLLDLREEYGYHSLNEFRIHLEKDSGMQMTCRRFIISERTFVYYFKIIDNNKFFLAKIKYGI